MTYIFDKPEGREILLVTNLGLHQKEVEIHWYRYKGIKRRDPLSHSKKLESTGR